MKLDAVHSQSIPSWVKNETDQQRSSTKTDSDEKTLDLKEKQKIQKLRQRDSEVRQHEMAHKTTGGKYAGNVSYTYQQGPKGNRYAVGGQVQMDTKPVTGKPQKTVKKAKIVKEAALAPAKPSAQDLKIASKAAKMKLEAKAKLGQKNQTENHNSQQLAEGYKELTPLESNKEDVSLVV